MELKELRIAKGLTQSEAADVVGVSLSSYKNHELGRSKMDSPLGRMILERMVSYKQYDFDRGILEKDYIVDTINEVFKDKEIDWAYLFGSYAKGVAKENSDVDILISGSITGLDYFSLGGELERALCKKVDLIRISDIKGDFDLIKEIMETGEKIYGKE